MHLDSRFPYSLTTAGEACAGVIADPNGRYLLTAMDKDGDENWQVYALPPTGGALLPVLHAEGEKFFPADLSWDGRFLYYTTSEGNPTFLNSYRYDEQRPWGTKRPPAALFC